MMTFSDSDSDSDNPIPKIQNCDNNGDIVPQFLAQGMNNTSSKQPSKNVSSTYTHVCTCMHTVITFACIITYIYMLAKRKT